MSKKIAVVITIPSLPIPVRYGIGGLILGLGLLGLGAIAYLAIIWPPYGAILSIDVLLFASLIGTQRYIGARFNLAECCFFSSILALLLYLGGAVIAITVASLEIWGVVAAMGSLIFLSVAIGMYREYAVNR